MVEGTHDPTWDENLQLNINHSDAPIRLEIDDHTALSNTLIGNIQRTRLLISDILTRDDCRLVDAFAYAVRLYACTGACTFTCQNLPPEEPTNMTLALDQGGEVDLELLWWPLDA